MRLIASPAWPFTLAEAKKHLRVDFDDDDDLITIYADAAIAAVDGPNGMTKRPLMAQTWEEDFAAFPSGAITLPLTPVLSVASITYDDADGDSQTLDSSAYTVGTTSVSPVDGWPDGAAVTVQWRAGLAECPADIKAAVLLVLGHLYANRETVAESLEELPMAARWICGRYRRHVLAS